MLNKGFYTAKMLGANGIYPYRSKVERYLSDMREYFVDKQAVDEILSSGRNPLIYAVYEIAREGLGELNVGYTVIYPGKVGDEYYFTRGHYHKDPSTSEVYIGVLGEGLILMQNRDGLFLVGEIEPGAIVYVPPGFAHRTVNTGKTELAFLAIYPSHAGHDYETIMKTGFAKIVVERGGKPTLIDNPNYRRI